MLDPSASGSGEPDAGASGSPANGPDGSSAFTVLLARAAADDADAAGRVFEELYGELRALAANLMARERSNHTLRPTELVHEAFARLVGSADTDWQNRAHFFASASRAMRRLLIDHARAKGADKRGGGWHRMTLDPLAQQVEQNLADVLSVTEALESLETVDRRAVRVVELRFFAGLTIAESADILGVSASTVEDDWSFARAWLGRRLKG